MIDARKDVYADWPAKGGLGDEPHPFALQDQGLPVPGVTRDPLPDGAPDKISPVPITHDKPILAPGAGGVVGPAVLELGYLLGKIGFHNTVTKGQNAHGIFDESLAAAAESFCRDFGVAEDPTLFPRDSRRNADLHFGPWKWEALLRVVARDAESALAK